MSYPYRSGIDINLAATGLRSNILKLHYEDKATPKQRAYVSALSGGVAGGAVTRLMGEFGSILLFPV